MNGSWKISGVNFLTKELCKSLLISNYFCQTQCPCKSQAVSVAHGISMQSVQGSSVAACVSSKSLLWHQRVGICIFFFNYSDMNTA